MRTLRVILVGAALLLSIGRVVAQQGIRVDEVRISGNQRVEDEAIRVRLRAQPGTVVREEVIDADIRALYEMGFFDRIEANLDTVGDRTILTYQVTERPFVQEVKLEGNSKLEREELETVLRIRPNTIFDPEKARRGIAEAKKLYEKKGYVDASITYTIEPLPDNQANVTFVVKEEKPVRIHEIIFEGNRAFSDRELKGVMQTKTEWILSFVTGAGTLDSEVLKTDVERLTAWYYEHGYIDVRIDEPIIARDEDGLTVTMKIDEGEVYRFGAIQLVGDVLPQMSEAQVDLHAQTGEIFRPSKLREDINELTEKYGNFGYAFVNVAPETHVDQADKTVGIDYRISQGPEVYIDRIEITGNTKTRDKVIRREIELAEQQRFSGTQLRRTQERLRRLGFFEDVNITTRKADREDRLDLVVDVKEASTGAFSAGAGISSGDQFLFNVRLSEMNLFGRGQRVIFNADIGDIRRNITLSFTEPYFLDTYLTLGLDAYNWELEFDDFTRGGTGGSVRTLYPFTALGWNELWGAPLVDTRIGLEYRIERAEISNVNVFAPSIIQGEQGVSLISSVIPRIYRDTRNHPFDPTAGSLQDFSFEFAGLGGDAEFINAQSRTRWYIPFWTSELLGTFVASTGWTFGYGLGLGNNPELPLFERYFPGGINSIRGFETRSLGPTVPIFVQQKQGNDACVLGPGKCAQPIAVEPIGGSQQLIFNNEIIFPLIQQLGLKGVVFFDAGNAFLATDGIDFDEMRMAAGFGIRWLSPIGPLRVEIGFPLNPHVGDDTQTVLFSFGGPP